MKLFESPMKIPPVQFNLAFQEKSSKVLKERQQVTRNRGAQSRVIMIMFVCRRLLSEVPFHFVPPCLSYGGRTHQLSMARSSLDIRSIPSPPFPKYSLT